MFTIKYRYFELPQYADKLPVYRQCEAIDGPFTQVSQEYTDDGRPVVYAYKDAAAPAVTFQAYPSQPDNAPYPVVYVMNAEGATVAKYEL